MESIYNSGCNHNWEFQGVYHENFAQWHCKNCSIVHAQNLAEMMNELQRARQYKIDRSAYVPGHWQCPLCHFYNVVTILNVNTGQYGMAKEHDNPFCPNDGHPMERVTWMQACESTEQTLKSEITRLAAERDTLRAENATLRAALQSIVNHDPKQFEVCCDEFAYDRLVKIYRDTARAALDEGANNG